MQCCAASSWMTTTTANTGSVDTISIAPKTCSPTSGSRGEPIKEKGRNPNILRDEWFCDGCYFSEDGCVIYTKDGKPLAYFDETCNTFQSHATGKMTFYYDLAGEQLWPARRA